MGQMDGDISYTWQTNIMAVELKEARADLAVCRMRLASMEQQRDSARRIARALYLYAMAECNWPYGHDSPLEAWARADRVLAEEARREEEAR